MKLSFKWLCLLIIPCLVFASYSLTSCSPAPGKEAGTETKKETVQETVAEPASEPAAEPAAEPASEPAQDAGTEKMSSDGGSPESTPDTKPPVKVCGTYCTNVMANCTGANKVYANKAACMAACAAMPAGKDTDKGGNTAYCRAYHAGAPAKGTPATHCPHAGISSQAGVCGTACDAYCDQVTKNCTGSNAQFKDRVECTTWCKGKPDGKWNATGGNSIACRAYHASFPAAGDAKTHCPHAGKDGGGVCADKPTPTACGTYCINVLANCTGANQVYGSKAACMAACKNMPVGKSTDQGGNTAYCRAYHAGAPAKKTPAVHCPHAGISSDAGVCGGTCGSYCNQVTKNCTGANKQHNDRAACMTWCKGKAAGKWNATGGDSIACRAYHASFPAAADAKLHCPHAGKDGGGVCSKPKPTACGTYCTNVLANCTGTNKVYANQATCMAACKNMPAGNSSDTSGNTAYCRSYHAGAPAKKTPAVHCPHAGISSDAGVCGSACDAYCDQVTKNCTGAHAQFKDRAACATWCKGKTAGKWNATGGDSIACRAYHASFPAASDAKLHCPHAGKTGGGVCATKPPTFKCKKGFASCNAYTDLTAASAKRDVSFGGSAGSNYAPKCIKIKVGQTVNFKGNFTFHPLKAACEETPTIPKTSSGSTKSVKFSKAGYYNYYCTAHGIAAGNGMAGNIWVVK